MIFSGLWSFRRTAPTCGFPPVLKKLCFEVFEVDAQDESDLEFVSQVSTEGSNFQEQEPGPQLLITSEHWRPLARKLAVIPRTQ